MIHRLALAGAVLSALLATPKTLLAHGDDVPAPVLPDVLLAWSLDPLPLLAIGLAGGAYLWAVRRVATTRRTPHPGWRTAAFLGGLVAMVLALSSPIEAYEGVLFSVHMVQHMLLELVAAPLILVGAPATLALRAASPSVRRTLLSILHSRAIALLTFPLLTWILFAAVNWGWHFSTLYDQALENVALHYFQHATFLGAALLFWFPVIGADPSRWRLPYPARLFYLFLAMPQNSFLGVALMSASSVLYPHYLTNLRTWGPTALADQSLGGILMWVGGDLVFLAAMGGVVAAWVRNEDRRTARLDARLDAEAAEAAEAEAAAQRSRSAGAAPGA
ncbi:MAG TPA: cytochrome c oxidase assembly protein [Candidatus Limnocylindria bacterium]|nr:cytochrome c oxidase assembly protein [Candidatus Limnocylindria bacterium]